MPGIEIKKLEGITSCIAYANGKIETCRVNMPNVISTPYGELIPQYSPPGIREKELKSVSFYESGMVRAVSLEAQTTVLTPLGNFPAELITFYEDGSLDSVFPLNGQIGFGWSEEEEKKLAETVEFDFSFGSFEAKPISLRFYPGGNFKSLILWPEEVITIKTPVGIIPVRIGLNLYENGSLKSVEPAYPVALSTPVGSVVTFDNAAVGIDADINSLRFDPDGNIAQLAVSGDIIVKNNTDGRRYRFSSLARVGLTDDKPVKMPIRVMFNAGTVSINNGMKSEEFNIADCEFLILSDYSTFTEGCGGKCDGCTVCS